MPTSLVPRVAPPCWPARIAAPVFAGAVVLGVTLLPHRALFTALSTRCGARQGRGKLLGEIGHQHGCFSQAMREAEQAQLERFNLDEDIGEKRNLAADFPTIYADLNRRQVNWLRQFVR